MLIAFITSRTANVPVVIIGEECSDSEPESEEDVYILNLATTNYLEFHSDRTLSCPQL